jgi:hypothetical protein
MGVRLKAMGVRLKAMGVRLKAMGVRLKAMGVRLKAMAMGVRLWLWRFEGASSITASILRFKHNCQHSTL